MNSSVNTRYKAYTPTFVPTPASSAVTGVNASAYVRGNQKNKGTIADLTPKANSNTEAMATTMPLSAKAATCTAKSAKLRVPVSPYNKAMPRSKNAEDTELTTRNLKDSLNWAGRPP